MFKIKMKLFDIFIAISILLAMLFVLNDKYKLFYVTSPSFVLLPKGEMVIGFEGYNVLKRIGNHYVMEKGLSHFVEKYVSEFLPKKQKSLVDSMF